MKYEPNNVELPKFITVDNYPTLNECVQKGWYGGQPKDHGKCDQFTTGVFHIKYKNQ